MDKTAQETTIHNTAICKAIEEHLVGVYDT